jgi:hypothetical protein
MSSHFSRLGAAARSLLPPGLAVLLLLLAVHVTARDSHAQLWHQKVEVAVALADDRPQLRAFVDSLLTGFERDTSALVRRAPDAPTAQSFAGLYRELTGEGYSLRAAANHVFISYDLVRTDGELLERIEGLHFIYRDARFTDEDVPLLYVSAKHPTVRKMLLHGGVPHPLNLASRTLFRDVLSLIDVIQHPDAQVVRRNHRVVREDYDGVKNSLLATIDAFIETEGATLVLQ